MSEFKDQIAVLQKEIQRYQALKAQIGTVISELDSASGQVGNLREVLSTAYSINGNSAFDLSLVANLKQEIEEVPLFLNGTVIPAIDEAIMALQEEEARIATATPAATTSDNTASIEVNASSGNNSSSGGEQE